MNTQVSLTQKEYELIQAATYDSFEFRYDSEHNTLEFSHVDSDEWVEVTNKFLKAIVDLINWEGEVYTTKKIEQVIKKICFLETIEI